jgi:hypothetical protein
MVMVPQFLKILIVVRSFFAFLLRHVAKTTRLHFCGVKWEKTVGIIFYRASMTITGKEW